MQAPASPDIGIPDPALTNSANQIAYTICKIILLLLSPHPWIIAWQKLRSIERIHQNGLKWHEITAVNKQIADALLTIEDNERAYHAKLKQSQSHKLMSAATQAAYIKLEQEIRQTYPEISI